MRGWDRMNEERNKLIKVRIDYQGDGQWYMKPEYNKKGELVHKGGRTFRGTDEEFRKFLMKCKVSDTDSTPASLRKKRYSDIIQDMKRNKKTYVWMYTSKWNKSNTMESRMEERMSPEEVYKKAKALLKDMVRNGDVTERWAEYEKKILMNLYAGEDVAQMYDKYEEYISIMNESKNQDNELIEITRDVDLPGTGCTLEAGDKIQVVKEAVKRDPDEIEIAIKRAFRQDLGIDEMEVMERKGPVSDYYEVISESGSASNGEREWMVFLDDDDAEREAIARVEEDLKSEPELFDRDFLSNYIHISDADRRMIASKEADNFVEGIGENEVLEHMNMLDDYDELDGKIDDLRDQYDEIENQPAKAESDEEFDKLQDQLNDIESQIIELLSQQDELLMDAYMLAEENKEEQVFEALKNPIQYYIEESGLFRDIAELMQQNFIQIDIEEAAEEAVNTDGVAYYLDSYDGEEEEITDPESGMTFFAYGTN